jgi:PAS domain S-box-containing protein
MAGGPGESGASGGQPPFVLFILRPRSQAMRLAWLVGALAVATLITALRLQIGLGTSGVPLVFFLPAVIAVTLIASWEYGAASLALSIAIVWFAFIPPPFSFVPPARAQVITIVLWSVVSVLLVAITYFLRAALLISMRNEQRYRRLTAVTSDIVWVTDGAGNVNAPHPSWTRVTGMAWPSYSGRNWLDAVHEDDRARLRPDTVKGDHAAEFRLRDANADDWRWYRSRAVALTGPGGDVEEWITAMRDVHESKLSREQDELMIGEARHRLKNLVTVIDALAKNSRQKGAPENAALDAYMKRFLGRLHALGAAADLVLAGQHQYVEIGAVVRATLAPFLEENAERFRIEGAAVTLSEATGGNLALAMHELATNAIKYGALSVPDGYVSIHWADEPAADGDRITIEWKEHGGPVPVRPDREGFGGRVIKTVPVREKNGEVKVEYPEDGLYCRIAFTKTAATTASQQ